MATIAPYGSWARPISAASLADPAAAVTTT
jgi:hypothetical protein